MSALRPQRVALADLARLGAFGLRTRPLRTLLSALGISVGIAAMIAVVGIADSSQASVNRQLAALGTNLLRVAPGQTVFGEQAHLPVESVAMVRRIGPVTAASATGYLNGVHVYRSDRIPSAETGSIAVAAARVDLLDTLDAHMLDGAWLNPATSADPTVVLGHDAAIRLGVVRPELATQVWLGSRWFTVIGIVAPVPLAPEIDSSALIGWPAAESLLGFDGYPTTIYARSRDDAVLAVKAVLGATADPEHPEQVNVSRPSDALAARTAIDSTLRTLLIGLGAVALIVGGVGVANTMIISVMERRTEIGLRRALGATRGNVRTQFLAESMLLALLGGFAGVALGILITAGFAYDESWPALLPAWASTGAIAVALAVGGVAGLYPAWRAARMPPTHALGG
jgi:putative ABC transport system permease protein